MNALQEEITQKTLALCVETGKITAQLLQQAMKKVLADMEKHKNDPQLHHGKQTLRQLMKHGAGVSNIEITDQNIKAFSATAKKYGIDFALKKDTTVGGDNKELVRIVARYNNSRRVVFKDDEGVIIRVKEVQDGKTVTDKDVDIISKKRFNSLFSLVNNS